MENKARASMLCLVIALLIFIFLLFGELMQIPSHVLASVGAFGWWVIINYMLKEM